MSSYKELTSSPAYNIVGESKFHIKTPSYDWIEANTVLSRTAYSTLYNIIGTLPDLETPVITPSSSGIVKTDLLSFANNTFYYSSGVNLFSSSVATTWTNVLSLDLHSYVGGKTFSRLGNTSTASVSLTDLTGGLASSPSSNDIVFISVASGSLAQTSMVVSGYTPVANLFSNSTHDANLFVGYKVMGATPDTTVTIPSSGNVDDAQTVAIQVWRNCDIINPLQVTSNTAVDVGPNVNPPIIVTTGPSTLLVVGAAGHRLGGNLAFTASYLSNFLTIGAPDDQNDSTLGFGSLTLNVSQTYDPAAWTINAAGSTQQAHAAVTMALNPLKIEALIYANNIYVYGGSGGILGTSTNGTSWTSRTSGTFNIINAIAYGNNTFVYVGSGGVLATSSNATTWTARTSGTSNNINGLVFGNNVFVYVGDNGTLATSANGVTWTARTSGTTANLKSVIHGSNTFVFAGESGILSTSTDGITWTSRKSGVSNTINSLSYDSTEQTFVYVADGGDIAFSSDAINWVKKNSQSTRNLINVTNGNRIIAVGEANSTINTFSFYSYNTQTEFVVTKAIESEILANNVTKTFVKG